MPPDDPDITALTGSRICHDLASPVGAALTGLDFLSGAPGTADPGVMALLRDSLTGARATLEMLRTAFGRAGTGAARDAASLGATARGHLAARPRLQFDWALDGPLTPATEQHLALAILCAAHALPRGGTLAVARSAQDVRVTVTAGGDLTADPALWDGLADQSALPAPDPRQVEFHLLAAHIARGNARITVTRDAQNVAIVLSTPAQD
ncbi:histidine phosphotransferase family protein [Roseovarius ramblicola]|uniref:Histidine phosphotransferase family protein n=1 Tax=Roseovarius ramblicola TaxID=2022336 RepID=A0ABV5I1Z8_9RHOB